MLALIYRSAVGTAHEWTVVIIKLSKTHGISTFNCLYNICSLSVLINFGEQGRCKKGERSLMRWNWFRFSKKQEIRVMSDASWMICFNKSTVLVHILIFGEIFIILSRYEPITALCLLTALSPLVLINRVHVIKKTYFLGSKNYPVTYWS